MNKIKYMKLNFELILQQVYASVCIFLIVHTNDILTPNYV